MRRTILLCAALCSLLMIAAALALLAGPGAGASAAAAAAAPAGRRADRTFVEDEVIVELEPPAAAAARGRAQAVGPAANRIGYRSLDDLATRFVLRGIRPILPDQAAAGSRLGDFFVLRLGAGRSIREALDAYRRDPLVRSAQPNFVYRPDGVKVPNDPLYQHPPNQPGQQWSHAVTRAEEGWYIETGVRAGGGVVIAVLGNGVEMTHPDLASQIYTNAREIPGNGIDDDQNGYVDDWRGWDFSGAGDNDPSPNAFGESPDHDTKVAGVAAAATDNMEGIASVCWGCRIMALKSGDTTSTVAAGINYAARNGARVLNMSFGSYVLSEYGPDTAVNVAVDDAYNQYRVVLVGTAGNNGTNWVRYPGDFQNVISVAATGSADERASFSNFGRLVDVAAPGLGILSTAAGGTYSGDAGTSFAAPYVAGVAGLLLSQDPTRDPLTIRRMIEYSADHVPADRAIGSGRVSVFRALDLGGPPTLFAAIKDPGRGDLIARGPLEIWGTALGSSYALEYQQQGAASWTAVSSGTQVENGTLGILDMTSLPVGFYDLRLTATRAGQPDQHQITVYMGGRYQSGWPQFTGALVPSAPVYADLDADNRLELMLSVQTQVQVFRADGSYYPGWPKEEFRGNGQIIPFYTTPAVGNIDADAEPEIVAAARGDAKIFAWDRDGGDLSSSPISVTAQPAGDYYFAATPTLVNLDSDPALEIVAPSLDGHVFAYNANGSFVTGWSASTMVSAGVNAPVATGDIDGDGRMEVLVRHGLGLTAFNNDGTIAWQVPLSSYGAAPVLGDLDGNHALDIVLTETQGAVEYVLGLNNSGQQRFRTPLPLAGETIAALSLADLNADGKLEVYASTTDSSTPPVERVRVLNDQGALIQTGWPASNGTGYGTPEVVIADVDGDGAGEVVAGSSDAYLRSWNGDGTTALAPLWMGGGVTTAAIGDLDGDGDVEVMAATYRDEVVVLDLTAAWSAQAAAWPMYRADAQHTGHYRFADAYADADGDGDPNLLDCAPADPAIHHGAVEACNLKDDDCDGTVDEGFDFDGDGYTWCGGDCNDYVPEVHPGAAELCNSYDDNCNGQTDEGFDADGDGYTNCGPDCDDTNPLVHPGVEEDPDLVCDGVDDDCDGIIDDRDEDHDGWYFCAGDCADKDRKINGIERADVNGSCFDDIDNDCDQVKDWDCAIDASSQTVPTGTVSPKLPGALNNIKASSPDDSYETLGESTLNKAKRLVSYWTFSNPNTSVWWVLRVEANRVATTGDEFNVSVFQRKSTDPTCPYVPATSYTTAFNVTKTTDDDLLQAYQIGLPAYGTVDICVMMVDTITSGDNTSNSIQVDKIYLMPILLDARATGEIPGTGTKTGNYLATTSDDGTFETLTEGGPSVSLVHTYVFDTVPIGSSHYLYFKAWRPSNADMDDFKFQWAPPDTNGDPGGFSDVPGGVINQARVISGFTSGTFGAPGAPGMVGRVFIRVVDTNGGTNPDRVSIDYLAIRTNP